MQLHRKEELRWKNSRNCMATNDGVTSLSALVNVTRPSESVQQQKFTISNSDIIKLYGY